MLSGFLDIIHGANSRSWIERLNQEVTPKQKHLGEKNLMGNMQGVFSWLDSLKSETYQTAVVANYHSPGGEVSIGCRQHTAIITVMEHILQGQQLDIERFEFYDDFSFNLDAQLEEYCYLVAGCVGEFWTEIGFISMGSFANVDQVKMNRWGINYGKGLQLINILRDLSKDLENGRCYLPGVDVADRSQVIREATRWRMRARDYLKEGATYADALVHRRTRMATALPGIIGARTLDLLDQADWAALEAGIKVSRSQVYLSAWDAFIR